MGLEDGMTELGDDNKTIFTSTELDSEEKAAVRSGEERGKRIAMAEDPERFGMARQRAINRDKYVENYSKIDWSK
jgi:hypothetical protein